MKNPTIAPPNINNKPRKGLKSKRVVGVVCDHIRLSLCFDREDDEVELRRYAVGVQGKTNGLKASSGECG